MLCLRLLRSRRGEERGGHKRHPGSCWTHAKPPELKRVTPPRLSPIYFSSIIYTPPLASYFCLSSSSSSSLHHLLVSPIFIFSPPLLPPTFLILSSANSFSPLPSPLICFSLPLPPPSTPPSHFFFSSFPYHCSSNHFYTAIQLLLL